MSRTSLSSTSLSTLVHGVTTGSLTPKQFEFILQQPGADFAARVEAILPLYTSNVDLFKSSLKAICVAIGLVDDSTMNGSLASQPESKIMAQQSERKVLANDHIQEVLIVCIDVSGSMQAPFESARTRLEAVKQMFYGFRDQTTNFEDGSKHRIGLISYDHRISIHTAPTENFAVFEDVIDQMRCQGSTAIYEAIAAACQMLLPWKSSHPNADLRVMCLSDGNNNCQKVTAEAALAQLSAIGAVCDCLIVGQSPDANLLRLVEASEGSAFQITSLAEGYECLESQAVISLSARRNGAPKPVPKPRVAPVDLCNVTASTPIRGCLVAPTPASATQRSCMSLDQYLSSTPSKSRGNQRRIAVDLANLGRDSKLRDLFDIFPSTSHSAEGGMDVDGIKLQLRGQPGTPYDHGVFEMFLQLPRDYPYIAPKLNLVTPIYHYAVSTQGSLCLPLLKDEWSPARNLSDVLGAVSRLIMTPLIEDPTCVLSQRSWLSELLRVDPQTYFQNAAAATLANAVPNPAFQSKRAPDAPNLN
jgi:ubiquitin-protein ligase/Mg-chelatase subunit ChlD